MGVQPDSRFIKAITEWIEAAGVGADDISVALRRSLRRCRRAFWNLVSELKHWWLVVAVVLYVLHTFR
jgi:hypothetical protein